MPDHFIIAGAQRSGTTRLCSMLEQHPQLCMARPIRPEPKFFLHDAAYALGRDGYRSSCFAHRTDELLLGEKSTSYIERVDAIARIKTVLPQVKLIFVLRHPVHRAYSNWQFSRHHGVETLAFEDALAAESRRDRSWDRQAYSVNPFAYARRGYYARQLQPWAEQFAREQIHLVTYESLLQRPAALTDLLRWLGLDASLPPSDPGRVNASPASDVPACPQALGQLWAAYRDDMQTLRRDWGLDTSVWHAPALASVDASGLAV